MNIKILDSWLREFLQAKATPKQISQNLSLTSVSIERIQEYKKDFIYDIEVTTNRPDLASVSGIAREASAVLPQFGIDAKYTPPSLSKPKDIKEKTKVTIVNDKTIVNRVCAVAMEVTVKPPPDKITERLLTSDIRSLNNLIDITNYVMRTIGHPTHVFDLDKIGKQTVIIRPSKKGEKIKTLDKKEYILPGGDIIAEDGNGEIIDLLGIMGLANSVVSESTKRILFFLDNNNPSHLRKTSMNLGIRSDAVALNEKGVDPELAMDAFLFGIDLYKKFADAKIISEIIDIYPNKPRLKTISVSKEKIDAVIGIPVSLKTSLEILGNLGFKTKTSGKNIFVIVPSYREKDIAIEEDLIEEIARVYGYHNIPSVLPKISVPKTPALEKNEFFWERRFKEALKYWGFTETYTYSMVSENLYEGPIEQAVTIKNPLSTDWIYMRKTLVPSLLSVLKENSNRDEVKLFELANVYTKKEHDLPKETLSLAGVIRKPSLSFFEVKGIIEQLLHNAGIDNLSFKKSDSVPGADILIGTAHTGSIEVLDDEVVNFELNFEEIVTHATLKKIYKPIYKYPPVIEDIAIIISEDVPTNEIREEILKQSSLIEDVSLLDTFENTRTFHILYQNPEKNLTSKDIEPIRTKILAALTEKFGAKLKE